MPLICPAMLSYLKWDFLPVIPRNPGLLQACHIATLWGLEAGLLGHGHFYGGGVWVVLPPALAIAWK